MSKATTTIRQVLHHTHGEWLHANQALFNQVASFYFEVIQAHVKVLDLSNKEALTVLRKKHLGRIARNRHQTGVIYLYQAECHVRVNANEIFHR